MYNFRYEIEEDDESTSIKIECWCTPKTAKEVDYKKHRGKIQKRIKQMTFNSHKDYCYDTDYIIDLDLRTSGVRYGKQSYMACQIMLFKTSVPINTKAYIKSIGEIIESDEYLSFEQNKMTTV